MGTPDVSTPQEPPRTIWIEAAYKLGVPAVIAVFLIWFLTQTVAAKLDAMDQMLSGHVGDQRAGQLLTQSLLRAICLNTAQTDRDRAGCEVGR